MTQQSRTESIARDLAAERHGAVSRQLLRDAGCDKDSIRHLFDHPRWLPCSNRVLQLVGAPRTTGLRLSSAVLDAGGDAVVAGFTAGGWWGMGGLPLEPILLTWTSSSTRSSDLAIVRRVRRLPRDWTTVLDGVPIVRPELLSLQLFHACRYERAERLTERMWSDRLISGPSLRRFLDQMGARGRNGSGGLRRYLDERPDDYVPPASGLEARAMQLLRETGLEFRRQVDVGDEQWTGRVDFLCTSLPLVLEIQSERHHTALVDVNADTARRARIEGAGFTVLELTDTLVWSAPAEFVRRVRAEVEALDR